MSEYIPSTWKDEKGRSHDLRAANLNPPASFICEDLGLQITLTPKEDWFNPGTQQYEPKEDTGLRLRFEHGYKIVSNKTVLKLLMESEDYKNGRITIDPKDPTGFWRAQGLLKTRKRSIVELEEKSHPSFGQVDLTKRLEGEPEPIAKAV